MTRSVEHIMSIEPPEMPTFVRSIREVEVGLGVERRILSEQELKNRDAVRRSIFLRSSAKKGQRLMDCDIEYRRPGFGIRPDQYDFIKEAKINREIKSGEILKVKDLSWN